VQKDSFGEFTARNAVVTTIDAGFSCWSAVSTLTAGGALCRRSRVGAAVAAEQSDQWGVSDPHLAAPFFAPRLALRGSLTPHMHVTIIRRDGAMPVIQPNAAPVSSGVLTSFALTARASVRFFRESAFIWVNAHFHRIAAGDSTRCTS